MGSEELNPRISQEFLQIFPGYSPELVTQNSLELVTRNSPAVFTTNSPAVAKPL